MARKNRAARYEPSQSNASGEALARRFAEKLAARYLPILSPPEKPEASLKDARPQHVRTTRMTKSSAEP